MRKRITGLIVLCLIVLSAVVAGSTQTVQISGKVTMKQADGTVTVNGQAAIKNSEIASGSTITTAARSSAVVSLGKLGRVEVMESTSMKLSFDVNSSTTMLDAGRVRVSTPASSTATVKTDDGEITTIKKQANEFTVDVTCGDTLVTVQKGRVELRAGSAVKQIAAGGQDTAGTATPGCRP